MLKPIPSPASNSGDITMTRKELAMDYLKPGFKNYQRNTLNLKIKKTPFRK